MRRASASSRASAARCCRRARPSSISVRSDAQEVRVVPRLLHEVAHAAPHRLDGEIHRAPAGHDDDRQQLVDAAWTRASRSMPFAARRRVAGVVQIHQQQIERAALRRRRAPPPAR